MCASDAAVELWRFYFNTKKNAANGGVFIHGYIQNKIKTAHPPRRFLIQISSSLVRFVIMNVVFVLRV